MSKILGIGAHRVGLHKFVLLIVNENLRFGRVFLKKRKKIKN